MILHRFYDEKLAQASYLLGCSLTGEALVIDPNRDIEPYLQVAAAERLRITHVTETHIHADFVSGTRELGSRAGATMLLSAEGGPDWEYGFSDDANVERLRHGDLFQVGTIKVDVAHTPGHTPEHIIFFITDGAAADRPIAVVTGDFVFVGDVGRPDLLEKAAKISGTMERSARQLFQSLQTFKKQPDYLQIWPGHGAGSACGKGLSAIPHSTIGYERLFNWAFAIENEDEFVRTVLAGQPEAPKYFAEMKRINREGPRVLGGGGWPVPPRLSAGQIDDLLQKQALIVDTRRAHEFAAGHIPGTISLPLDKSFTTWAGWLLPYDREFYLILSSDDNRVVTDAVKSLAAIGLDRFAGYFTSDAITTWLVQGRTLQTVPHVKVDQLADQIKRGSVQVIDVRAQSEWEAGHVPGVSHIPLGYLLDRKDELKPDVPIVLHCQGGGRSAIAAALLQAHGFSNVSNLVGGFSEWQRRGNPIEIPNESPIGA
jgi:hydroxyacylglutathione hydrolase